MTTGALYKRYRGKEELFSAVVSETVTDLDAVLEEKRITDFSAVSDEELARAWEMDEGYMMWWFRFLYDRHDGFVLPPECAEGTAYSNFLHDWVEKMTESTYAYYLEARRRRLTDVTVSEDGMHILFSVFWTTIYEPFNFAF